jgi:hypothetical protein
MEKNNDFTKFFNKSKLNNSNINNDNEKQFNNNNNKESRNQSWNQYMASKRQKLMKQFNEEVVKFNDKQINNKLNNNTNEMKSNSNSDLSKLFSGVCIYVNGYTNPSALELKQMMAKYGGIYLNNFDGTRTTHTIANNLPFAKLKDLKGNEKIVKPEWVVDSIKQKKLLPLYDYLLVKASGDIERFLVHKNTDKLKSNSDLNESNICEEIEVIDNQSNDDLKIEGRFVQNISELFDNQIDSNLINTNHQSVNQLPNNESVIVEEVDINDNKTDETIVSKPETRKTTTYEPVLATQELVNKTKFNESNYIPNSMSQIDQEFLNALPLSLRQEISSTINCNNSMNEKTIKTSNVITINEKSMNQKKNYNKKKLKSSPKKSIIVKPVKSGPLDKIFKELRNMKRGGLLSSNINANICGKTKPKDVIDLIDEWISTEEDLIDEDIAYVTKYFCDLIDERKYDQLLEIGIAFYEFVEQRNQMIWKESYNDIRNTIINELKTINISIMSQINNDLPSFQLSS